MPDYTWRAVVHGQCLLHNDHRGPWLAKYDPNPPLTSKFSTNFIVVLFSILTVWWCPIDPLLLFLQYKVNFWDPETLLLPDVCNSNWLSRASGEPTLSTEQRFSVTWENQLTRDDMRERSHWQRPRPRLIKNGLYRIVRRCSYCTETLMPLGTVVTLSISVTILVSVSLGWTHCKSLHIMVSIHSVASEGI